MKTSILGRGFTLVEIIVVIAVIGILATVSILGLTKFQSDSRDAQRNAAVTTISEALEKYYEHNGEYPGCSMLTGSVSDVATTLGIDQSALTLPSSETDNAVICTNISTSTNEDVIAYVGDGSPTCTTGTSCLEYSIKYKEESTGEIVSLGSRRKVGISTSGNTTLTVSPSGQTAINASWTAVPNATGYTLERNKTNTFPNDGSTTPTTGASLSAPQTGLQPGTTYFFRLKSLSSTGDGAWTSVVSAKTDSIPTPTISSAVASAGRNTIKLTLTTSTGATAYTVQRATNSSFSANLVTVGSTSTNTITDSTPEIGTTYYYRAKATNASNSGDSGWGATKTGLIAWVCSDKGYVGTYPSCGVSTTKLFTDGDYTQCALGDDNGETQLYCWGTSGSWSSTTPTRINSSLFTGKTITDASFSDQVCVVASTLLYCQGDLASGSFAQVTGGLAGKTVTDVEVEGFATGSVDSRYQCAIASGELYCWGVNSFGQLGIGSTTTAAAPTKVAGALAGKTVTSVSLSLQSTCAVANGQLYCWGMRLPESTTATYDTAPVLVSGLSGYTANAVDLANNLACVSTTQLRAFCYGNGDSDYSTPELNNRFATNSTPRRSTATLVPIGIGEMPNNTSVVSIAGWAWNKCVLASDNNAYCWGIGINGDLGNGATTSTSSAVQVLRQTGVLGTKVITSLRGQCVLADSEMYCWGVGVNGRLGNGSSSNRSSPVKVRIAAPSF